MYRVISALRSREFLFTVTRNGKRRKVLKIAFGKGGDIYFFLSYVVNSVVDVSRARILGNGRRETTGHLETRVSTRSNFKVSYHASGQVHISGSPELDAQRHHIFVTCSPITETNGHIFTAQIQNLDLFERGDQEPSPPSVSPRRTVLDFEDTTRQTGSGRIVVFLETYDRIRKTSQSLWDPSAPIGPVVSMSNTSFRLQGEPTERGWAYLVAPPLDRTPSFLGRALLVSMFGDQPLLTGDGEAMTVICGFDQAATTNDLDASFNHLLLRVTSDSTEE